MSPQKVTFRSSVKDRPSKKLLTLSVSLITALSLVVFGGTAYLSANGLDALEFYSNLANPYMRFVNIPAGERREQIAETFQKVLSWNPRQVQAFLNGGPKDLRGPMDGYYMPGTYWVRIGASGSEVARQMLDSFNSKISSQILDTQNKTSNNNSLHTPPVLPNAPVAIKNKINLDTAVRIASIIQREAAGKVDMNLISGVIWNRLFKGMSLDMDATLQYVKGTSTNWWPEVHGKDKYISSPFNTYKNKGLPPTAIANPSVDAIRAAMNPQKTDCLFYLHDNNRSIHCTVTYADHKVNVERYLMGQR